MQILLIQRFQIFFCIVPASHAVDDLAGSGPGVAEVIDTAAEGGCNLFFRHGKDFFLSISLPPSGGQVTHPKEAFRTCQSISFHPLLLFAQPFLCPPPVEAFLV